MTAPRVIVSRPAGPDGPAVLAVYGDSPAPIVAVPLTPHRVLRLARELLAAVEPSEIGPERPAHARPAGPHPEGAKGQGANPESPQGGSRTIEGTGHD